MNPEELKALIESRIKNELPDAEIILSTHDNLHYQATVRSAHFAPLKKLEQHRLVMNTLSDVFQNNSVHALQLKTEIK